MFVSFAVLSGAALFGEAVLQVDGWWQEAAAAPRDQVDAVTVR